MSLLLDAATNPNHTRGTFAVADTQVDEIDWSSDLALGPIAGGMSATWTTVGNVTFDDDQLRIDEHDLFNSSAVREWVISDEATYLRFTITDALLGASENQPPDVFEVALLDAAAAPVAGVLAGLDRTDALLNVQHDAATYLAASTTLSRPLEAADGSLVVTEPVDVTIDLSGVPRGVPLTLYFDLLGFGAVDSSISIANVHTDADVLPPGIIVTPTTGLITSEDGRTAQFDVYLSAQPTDNVSVELVSSDSGEGALSRDIVVFTPDDWDVPQTITVTGIDDEVPDGTIAYNIITDRAVSLDGRYHGMNPVDVLILNLDNDPDILVSPTEGLVTSEAGGEANFDLVLTVRPDSDVSVSLFSTNSTEGALSHDVVTFTPDDWDIPQTVTVTGVSDQTSDGAQSYHIVTAWAVSLDARYHGLNPADVQLTNLDNNLAAAAFVAGSHWSDSFFARLNGAGIGDVEYGFEIAAYDGQVSAIAWPELDVLSIMAGRTAGVTDSWLLLRSVSGRTQVPNVSKFSFDASTHTATWQFERPIPQGLYLLTFGPPDELLDFNSPSVSRFEVHFSPGDLDHDLDVDADDIDALQRAIRNDSNEPIWDLNADGTVNGADFTTLVSDVLGTARGDVNLDGFVDQQDVDIWENFQFSEKTGWASGDVNGDTVTDVSDFNMILGDRTTDQAMTGAAHPRGDIDLDGLLTVNDVNFLQSAIHIGQVWRRADLDTNRLINSADVDNLVIHEFQSRPGDANLDRRVDGTDFNIWWRQVLSDNRHADWSTGDFDSDGVADARDAAIWLSNRFWVDTPQAEGRAEKFKHRAPRAPLPTASTAKMALLDSVSNVYFNELTSRRAGGTPASHLRSEPDIAPIVDRFFIDDLSRPYAVNRRVDERQLARWARARSDKETNNNDTLERIDAFFADDDHVSRLFSRNAYHEPSD